MCEILPNLFYNLFLCHNAKVMYVVNQKFVDILDEAEISTLCIPEGGTTYPPSGDLSSSYICAAS